jgi:hypothetical protein
MNKDTLSASEKKEALDYYRQALNESIALPRTKFFGAKRLPAIRFDSDAERKFFLIVWQHFRPHFAPETCFAIFETLSANGFNNEDFHLRFSQRETTTWEATEDRLMIISRLRRQLAALIELHHEHHDVDITSAPLHSAVQRIAIKLATEILRGPEPIIFLRHNGDISIEDMELLVQAEPQKITHRSKKKIYEALAVIHSQLPRKRRTQIIADFLVALGCNVPDNKKIEESMRRYTPLNKSKKKF